jgi:hypothetical protein
MEDPVQQKKDDNPSIDVLTLKASTPLLTTKHQMRMLETLPYKFAMIALG